MENTERTFYAIRNLRPRRLGERAAKPWVRIGPETAEPSLCGRALFTCLGDARAAMRFVTDSERAFDDTTATVVELPAADCPETGEFVVVEASGEERADRYIRLNRNGVGFVEARDAMVFGTEHTAQMVAGLVKARTGRVVRAGCVPRGPRTGESQTAPAAG